MDDRRAPPDPATPERGTFAPVSVAGRGGPFVTWVVVAALALVVAGLKPWGGEIVTPGPTPLRQVFPPATGGQGSSSGQGGGAIPSASADEAEISRICLDTGAWLVATEEQMQGRPVRVWRALDPVAALPPDHPAIPRLVVGTEALTELGWCAPVVGPDRPVGVMTVEAWVLVDGMARPLELRRDRPAGAPSSFGALYGPPAAGSVNVPGVPSPSASARDPVGATAGVSAAPPSAPASWSSGLYVFRLSNPNGIARSFAVQLEIVPRLGPGRSTPHEPRPTPLPTAP